MTDRELLQQALNALEYHQIQTRPINTTTNVISAIRARLAQPEQEPVAWYDPDEILSKKAFRWCKIGKYTKPLYTAPTQPAQKPLTYTQVLKMMDENSYDEMAFVRAIEAAHGIKEI